jgi:hypothetical protein
MVAIKQQIIIAMKFLLQKAIVIRIINRFKLNWFTL